MRLQQFFDPRSLNRFSKPFGGFLLALLAALVVVGCGGGTSSDRGSFVAPPPVDGTPTGSGSITYSFVKAPNARIEVPATTQNLRFDFYTGQDGTGTKVKTETRPYADEVTITGVPVTVRSSIVTALDGDGFPTYEFTANHVVEHGQNILVNIGSGTGQAVNLTGLRASPLALSLDVNSSLQLQLMAQFSNGDQVRLNENLMGEVEFTTNDTTIVNVQDGGLVVSSLPGSAAITTTFRGVQTTVPVVVAVGGGAAPIAEQLTVTPTSVELPVGTLSEELSFEAVFEDGVTRPVTLSQGIAWSSTIEGVTVTENGQIQVGNEVVAPVTGTVTFTYTGRTAQVQVSVTAAELTQITVSPASASLPFGGFEQDLTVSGTFTDGQTLELADDVLTFTESSPLFTVDPSGLVVTAATGTAGTANVTVEATVGDVTLTETVAITVGEVYVASLFSDPAAPPATDLAPGAALEFTITAELSDNQSVDVTDFQALQIVPGGDVNAVAVNRNRVVGIQPGTAEIEFTLPGTGQNGADATTGPVQVNVMDILLTSVEVLYAGNPIGDQNQLNLPRGYVGVFEVLGTFSNGSQRLLYPDEYRVEKLGTGSANPEALQLFDHTYVPTAVAGRYIDGNPRDPGTQDTADQVVDDLVTMLGTVPRAMNPSATRTDVHEVATRPTFRAVVADWRRWPTEQFVDIAVPGPPGPIVPYEDREPTENSYEKAAPNATDNFEIRLADHLTENPGDLDRRDISITVSDPRTVVITEMNFRHYPEDNRVAVGNPREIEVWATFESTVGVSGQNGVDPDPQGDLVLAQNFRLADANVLFATDQLLEAQPQLIYKVPTEVGYPALARNLPLDIGAIEMYPTPLLGIAGRPYLLDEPESEGGTASNPDEYTPGSYLMIYNQFGPGWISGTGFFENTDFRNVVFDPGPPTVDSESYAVTRRGLDPPDGIWTGSIVETFDGDGFEFSIPTLFTIDPAGTSGAMELEVGASQLFRVLVQFSPDQEILDRTLDYRLRIVPGSPASVVGRSILESGRLLVSGIADGAPNSTVEARDTTGELINAVGSFTDALGNEGPGQAEVEIDVIPAQ